MFTGALVAKGGTFVSSKGFTATAFKAEGGNLTLSGALSAANVALTATDGGTLTLSGATITDSAPDLTLAGGGTTDYFTRDITVGSYTFDSLTLGEGAVLDLDGNATAIDTISATTTNITATTGNKATININFTSAPAADTAFTFFATDSADKFTVNPKLGSLTIPHEVSVKNGMLTLTIVADDYTWNGLQTNWGDTGAWMKNDAPADWSDGNNAIFSTANATANLAANAAASEVRFTADATVSGSATLTAAKVNVADGVSATISAPTASAIEKTGAGTLTLGASRTDQTTLSEGTLAMANGATVDSAKLTLGTDAAKPVTFDYGGQTFSADLTPALGGYDVSLTNGNFTSTVKLVVADGTLRVKKDSSVSANGHVAVGGTSDTAASTDINALLEIDGGAVTNSASNKHCIIGDFGEEGSVSRLVVKNGGSYYSRQDIVVGNRSTGYLTVDNSTVEAYGYLYFCYDAECLAGENGYVSLTNNGVLAVQKVTYREGYGNGYFNFDGGTLKATANQTLLEKNDRLFVNVNAAGGTIDNNGKTITINADLLGAGDMMLIGSGKTTIGGSQTGTGALNVNAGTVAVDGGVSVARPTTVASGATLTVNGTAETTVDTLALEAGSTLNIASGTFPLSVAALTLPDSGKVTLTHNGGAFSAGIYKILGKTGITTSVAEKFDPSTGSEGYSFTVSGNTLVLNVGTSVHGRWKASAGSGNFSDPGNWEDGQVPSAGDELDFSGVTSGITINCGDLSATSFAGVTLPTAKVQVTINGTLRVASMTVVADSRNFSVASGSKLIVDGDVELSSEDNKGIRYIVYNNYGEVEIGGKVITSGKPMGYPCYNCSNSATITVKGIVSGSSGDHFKLNAFTATTKTSKWIIGRDGLRNESGKKEFWLDKNISAGAELKAAEDFAINSTIGARRVLTLDTDDGKTITVNGEIYTAPEGTAVNTLTVKGSGSVKICNTFARPSGEAAFTGDVIVTNTATLAINAGKQVTTGAIIVNTNATLQVAQSAASAGAAAVTLGGGLTLKAGAALGFNYTNRNAPKLDLTDRTVTFDEGATTNVFVKISADAGKRAKSGKNVLTAGYKFAGVTVSVDENYKPKWVKGISVENGDIVLDVKPMPTLIIVR